MRKERRKGIEITVKYYNSRWTDPFVHRPLPFFCDCWTIDHLALTTVSIVINVWFDVLSLISLLKQPMVASNWIILWNKRYSNLMTTFYTHTMSSSYYCSYHPRWWRCMKHIWSLYIEMDCNIGECPKKKGSFFFIINK